MNLYLGIDTSAYTTSIALIDEQDNIKADERILLKVEQGKRGLRQSEALFLHIKNLPLVFKRIESLVKFNKIISIGVSSKPRNVEGSYMPVFLAGINSACIINTFLNIPLFEISHQEGHIASGIITNKELHKKAFLAVHFSGGTSEVVYVKPAIILTMILK